jgi:hypothetical protein
MFVLTRRSALPRLRFVPGGLARWHDDRITLFPLAPSPETALTVQPLPGGGYGVILNEGGDPSNATVVAQYPTRPSTRRQLRRLAADAGWSAAGWLGRGLLLAALLFVAWFLFFVPGDPAALAALEGRAAGDGLPSPPSAAAPATGRAVGPPAGVPADDGPAFVDDPADRVAPGATDAALDALDAPPDAAAPGR